MVHVIVGSSGGDGCSLSDPASGVESSWLPNEVRPVCLEELGWDKTWPFPVAGIKKKKPTQTTR